MTDYILRGGEVIDGSGKPGFAPISRSRTTASRRSGDLSQTKGAREIDVSGMVARARLYRHPHP